MRTQAAILWHIKRPWQVEEALDLVGEVQSKLASSGLFHSGERPATGDLPGMLPIVCGHEGARTVEAVGTEATNCGGPDLPFSPGYGQPPEGESPRSPWPVHVLWPFVLHGVAG